MQQKKGEEYQALKTDEGHTLQLVVSWRQDYHPCDDKESPNEVTTDCVNEHCGLHKEDNILTQVVDLCS